MFQSWNWKPSTPQACAAGITVSYSVTLFCSNHPRALQCSAAVPIGGALKWPALFMWIPGCCACFHSYSHALQCSTEAWTGVVQVAAGVAFATALSDLQHSCHMFPVSWNRVHLTQSCLAVQCSGIDWCGLLKWPAWLILLPFEVCSAAAHVSCQLECSFGTIMPCSAVQWH
jgi:hypothetical protein